MKKNLSYEEFAAKVALHEKEHRKQVFNVERLRKVMSEHQATAYDIAKQYYSLGNVGNVKERIYNIFESEILPDAEDIKLICQAVNVSADYLMNLSDRVN